MNALILALMCALTVAQMITSHPDSDVTLTRCDADIKRILDKQFLTLMEGVV